MKPKGSRKFDGRRAGTPNKTTVPIREAARLAAPEALARLLRLSKESESEQVKLAACKEILDRAYGKPRQPVGRDDAGRPRKVVVTWAVRDEFAEAGKSLLLPKNQPGTLVDG